MCRTKVLIVYGTRPEAIKLAPVINELQTRREEFDVIQCSTGQHREMLDQVTRYFSLKPDFSLDVMRPNQTLAGLTSRLFEQIDHTVKTSKPDCVIAQGDTTSVMVSAITAFYQKVPFVHVEAGLRTGRMDSPFPEEFNRRVAGLVTELHCAPTERAADALRGEGVAENKIRVTGNTVVDALLWAAEKERKQNDQWISQFPFVGQGKMVLITAHRRESFGAGFQNICQAIADLANEYHDTQFVYPVHLNPNVQKPVYEILGGFENVHLIQPQAYPAFVWLMDQSYLILTDSGGIQEEAPSLQKPVIVMRDTSERMEAVDQGAVELVGTDHNRIVQRVSRLLSDQMAYKSMQHDTNPYGDGKAAKRIADWLHESEFQAIAENLAKL
jgi:UDP-N-acetylglucosamine 2-epimerase (non-hydrolysing)